MLFPGVVTALSTSVNQCFASLSSIVQALSRNIRCDPDAFPFCICFFLLVALTFSTVIDGPDIFILHISGLFDRLS